MDMARLRDILELDNHHPWTLDQRVLLPVPEDGSCDLHRNHGSAQPLYLEGHHVFPIYMQHMVWPGEVRVEVKAAICATGHNAVHVIITDILKARTRFGTVVPREWQRWRTEYQLAVRGVQMYLDAAKEANVPVPSLLT